MCFLCGNLVSFYVPHKGWGEHAKGKLWWKFLGFITACLWIMRSCKWGRHCTKFFSFPSIISTVCSLAFLSTSEELTSFWVWDWHIYENHLSCSDDCTDSLTLSSARAMDQMRAVTQSKGWTFVWKQAEAAALTGIKQRIEHPVIVPTANNCPLIYYVRG